MRVSEAGKAFAPHTHYIVARTASLPTKSHLNASEAVQAQASARFKVICPSYSRGLRVCMARFVPAPLSRARRPAAPANSPTPARKHTQQSIKDAYELLVDGEVARLPCAPFAQGTT
jgi:hypothetical protein